MSSTWLLLDGSDAKGTDVLPWDTCLHRPAQDRAYVGHRLPALLRLVLPLDKGTDENSTRNGSKMGQ